MSAARADAERRNGAVSVHVVGKVAYLTLDRPERRNALVPELVDGLREAISGLDCDGLLAAVIGASGATFSSGGDIAAFFSAALRSVEDAEAYAKRVVGGLHDCIKALIALPVPVVARVQGFATGGACGLIFASDIVVMADDAFFQPYYAEVGFAPDGAWTALLPEIIGPGRAVAFQATNRRISAAEAVALGLATTAVSSNALDAEIEHLVGQIAAKAPGTLRATRALVWDQTRRGAIAARLDAEERLFIERIGLPETRAGMERFMSALRRKRMREVTDAVRDRHGGPTGRVDT
jgi:2-(1,2-epoxy-1,2-dihydrophenyl)acetyl-CoA isomerase